MYESLLKHTAEYQKISASLATPGPAALFGLPPAGRALLYAALQKDLGRVLCIVTPGEAEATHFADDLKALGLTAAVFPPRDFMLRPVEGAGREYEYRRLSVLGALAGGRLNAVCVPAEALLQYTVPRAEFQKNTLTLKPGMVYNREALVERLFSAGYVRRSQVDGPGQFSVRGDIVDIYAPDMHQPARIEYWDDEIDSLASFDLLTQRRDGSLEKIYLSPAREVLFGSTADTAEALRAAQKKARGKHRTALEKAMEADLSQLDSGLMPEAMDKYYGLRYPAPATLLDHLDSPLFVLDEVGGIRDAQKATEFRRGEELTGLLEEGVLCPGLDVLYQTMDDLVFAAQKQSTLLCENFLRGMNEFQLKDLINAEAFAAPNWGGDLASLREDLDPLIAQGYAVTLFAGTPKGAAALTRDLADKGYSVSMSRDVRPAKGLVQVLPGHLTAGCTFPFAQMAVISSRRHGLDEAAEAKKRKKNKNALSSLSDIKPGDYVVHQSHGIGMYAGIQRLEVQGAIKDYLKIQYSGSDVLYVPVTQLDLLSRYTAPGDEEKVKLAKLGGTEWQRTRAKVKKATEEMAQELIELYARRRQAPGYAFPPDGDWQSDFEARFEYDETDDQLNATSEIKKDMERSYPMDRLLCGDVGVGKTEVALRAAFKCVMGGKQCAILAPTTLLAWQHYNTILSRMEAFPVKVGMLSRFRTAKQQKETLRGLQAGSVDIVVGTHRLLSKDVRFHDLGLVIIDEEQRFGVKHKEKLKENFIGVDMLTLSATPIPRTLNMAMSGIRDLSTIEQPPIERQPVETFVLEYNDVILAEAMKKELARGGQVYYLHNRVETIDRCAAQLKKLLGEEVSIAVAHGKLDEKGLSHVMQQFSDGEAQILVCTTIIETGIDIPNVNTLIIEDADKLGLAQLHQIRGRVGRSSRHAYAYLTFKRGKVLTEVAEKRLNAIRDYAEFGSGFKIAMRDLEIRGAGNLLGSAQSGHMLSVGYDLYLKLLEEAVLEERGEKPAEEVACTADLDVTANIDKQYVSSGEQRMDLYRRMAAVRSQEDADELLDEIVDRYGDPPKGVMNLLAIALLRAKAAALGISDISQKGRTLRFTYAQFSLEAVAAVCGADAYKKRVFFAPNAEKPLLTLNLAAGEDPLRAAQEFVKFSQEHAPRS